MSAQGLLVHVRVTPRGGRDALEGAYRDSSGAVLLKARLKAAPADGQANAALLALLAEAFGVSKSDVALVRGAAARVKTARVAGDPTALAARLAALLAAD